jgi:hypothetical protein
MTIDVTTTYLEMHSKSQLKAKPTTLLAEIKQVEIPLPELNRFFYLMVGHDWYWYDRLNWSYEKWREWVERSELQTWVLYLQGTPAGYVETESRTLPDTKPELWLGANQLKK